MFHEKFMKEEVSKLFHRSFKGVSRKFEGCFKKVSMEFQESFMGISRMFQGCFKVDSNVSMIF